MSFQFLPQPQGPQGLAGWIGSYQGAQRNALQNQQLGINNQYLPDYLQGRNNLQNANAGMAGVDLQYRPQTDQADIASKNAYANLAPFTMLGSLDPAAKLMIERSLYPQISNAVGNQLGNKGGSGNGNPNSPNTTSIPPLVSYDGGMTAYPAPNPQQPPYRQTDQNAGLAGNVSNYPVLPGGQAPNATIGQLNAGPQGLAGMPPGMTATNQPMNPLDMAIMNTIRSFGKDSRFGSSRSGAGGTYLDSSTGQEISTDTTANTSADQRTVGAIDRVTPQLQQLMQYMPQFQSGTGRLGLELGTQWNAHTPQGFPKANSPDDYAKGQEALLLAPESLLKAYNLNVTNDSLDRVGKAIEPIEGETSQGYIGRVKDTLGQLKQNQNEASARLSGGTPLTTSQQQQSAPAAVNIPTFSSKQEFQQWYGGLQADDQAQVKQQLSKGG